MGINLADLVSEAGAVMIGRLAPECTLWNVRALGPDCKGSPAALLAAFRWGVPMPQYLLSMLIGRGKRVFVLAAVIRLGGARAEAALRRSEQRLQDLLAAIPAAIFARRSAVAGQTRMKSAERLSSIWPISTSSLRSQSDV